MAAVHYTGTGLPGQATATAFHAGNMAAQRAQLFSDAGLTTPADNPFVAVNGAYDFWADDTKGVVYVVVGYDPPIYEDLGMIRGGDEYLAPDPDARAPLADYGEFTPTLTIVSNLDSLTASGCQWSRVGKVVTVSGSFLADPTTSGLDTEFGMTLPIASNFTVSSQCGGMATCRDVVGEQVAVAADTTNKRADFRWITSTNAARTYRFIYQYVVK